MAFNHDSDKLSEALGLTADEFEEINFKSLQIVRRGESRSRSTELALEWANERFGKEDIRNVALLLLGGSIERAIGIRDISDQVDSIKKNAIQFESEEGAIAFIDELKSLAEEFNGTLSPINPDSPNSAVAIVFSKETDKALFQKRLNEIEIKHQIKRPFKDKEIEEDVPFMWNFGPIAEA